MKLREYIFRKRLKLKEFAELIDITPLYLGMIVNGRHKASKKVARNVERATKGIVTQDEVLHPEKYRSPEDDLIN